MKILSRNKSQAKKNQDVIFKRAKTRGWSFLKKCKRIFSVTRTLMRKANVENFHSFIRLLINIPI